MGKIESFSKTEQLLKRIEHYKQYGLDEERMTVISATRPGNILKDYPGIEQKSAKDGAWDQIAAWMAGEDPEEKVMEELHLDDTKREVYRKSLENGKMLLFIDYNNKDLYTGRKINTQGAGTNGESIHPTNKVTGRDEDSIPLREEQLVVDKEEVNMGEVVVNKYTDSKVEDFDVPVERDDVTVKRRPLAGEPLFDTYNHEDSDDEPGVIRIPITKDRIKIIKEKVVAEEIIIRKNKVKDTKRISEVVSHEDIEVSEVRNEDADTNQKEDR